MKTANLPAKDGTDQKRTAVTEQFQHGQKFTSTGMRTPPPEKLARMVASPEETEKTYFISEQAPADG